MSDPVAIAIVGMVGGSMAAAIAAWVKIKTLAVEQKRDAENKDKQLREIHVLVDGNLSRALRELAELKQIVSDEDPANPRKALAASDAARVMEHKEISDQDARAAGMPNPKPSVDADAPAAKEVGG